MPLFTSRTSRTPGLTDEAEGYYRFGEQRTCRIGRRSQAARRDQRGVGRIAEEERRGAVSGARFTRRREARKRVGTHCIIVASFEAICCWPLAIGCWLLVTCGNLTLVSAWNHQL